MITIKKGLDLPIAGAPSQTISQHTPKTVAVIGYDYAGMRPTMLVSEGDVVKKGQPIFADKKRDGIHHVAPASGVVRAILRGERRVFESLVIDVQGSDEVDFTRHNREQLTKLDASTVEAQLIESGEWTALRTRPFGRTPHKGSRPDAIFVTAIDTNPLSFDPMVWIDQHQEAFCDGIAVLSTLSPKTYVCHKVDRTPPISSALHSDNNTSLHAFSGVHPAGLAGTHIHFLHPLAQGVTVWTIGYQDVIAIGKLFTTGKLFTERLIALGGPVVGNAHLIQTMRGADLHALTSLGQLQGSDNRIISGSVLAGRKVTEQVFGLGRFDNQVCVIQEGYERPQFHFFSLGINRFSKMPIYLSRFTKKLFNFTSSTNGSARAMVPIGVYEDVMPQDYLATQLLKALIVEDMDNVIALGGLELIEEDMGCCSFVSPGKYEFGDILRDNLTRIELEG